MHEFGIASRLIEAASETAASHHARRVNRLVVRIGALRQIDGRLLTEAFHHLRSDTDCAEAELEVVKCGARAVCAKCGARYEVRGRDWRCGVCGGDGEFVGGGDPLRGGESTPARDRQGPAGGPEQTRCTCGDELELMSIDAEIDE